MSRNTLFFKQLALLWLAIPQNWHNVGLNVNFSICLSVQWFPLNHVACILFYVVKEVIGNQWLVWDLTTRRQKRVQQKKHTLNNLCRFRSFLLASLQFDSMKRHFFRSNKPNNVLFHFFLFNTVSLSAPQSTAHFISSILTGPQKEKNMHIHTCWTTEQLWL